MQRFGAPRLLRGSGRISIPPRRPPGLRVSYGGVSGFATFGVPIVNQVNGLQSKTEYRAFTGISYTF